jgi:type V secretory pathway adhesin AidA
VDGIRISQHGLGNRDHPCECPRQIHRRWPRPADDFRVRAELGQELIARSAGARTRAHDQSHCAGDTDRRGATHGQRSDRVAHVVERRQLAIEALRRQEALVDDHDTAITPTHGLNDAHALKLRGEAALRYAGFPGRGSGTTLGEVALEERNQRALLGGVALGGRQGP